MVLTPLPPLFCARYSSTSVRLPYPRRVMARTCDCSSVTTVTPTTFSPSVKSIPLTPAAVRPIDLTWSSWNLMALPLEAPIIISLWPSVNLTECKVSSSLRLMALIPLARIFWKSSTFVLFVIPLLVVKNK